MMDLLLATSGGESQSASGGYVDDVFSAYTYTGNGSTQTINNRIDLVGKGGLVWIKSRTAGITNTDGRNYGTNFLRDSTSILVHYSNDTRAKEGYFGGISFSSNGFSTALGYDGQSASNPIASWTFRKNPCFFDIVTYTGNGASNRALSHQLNADVGMITVKATSTTSDWWVFHRSATGDLVLNTTAAQTASKANIPSATTSTFTVNGSANTNGVTYVAYLWAHDPSADGVIQCGSFATDGSGISAPQNLGWEPQYLMIKRTNIANDWQVYDQMRGFGKPTYNCKTLYPNILNAESDPSVGVEPEATGFKANGLLASSAYIYLAIRRPNKPPTSGTEVYNAIARTGTGAAATVTGVGFAPDLVIDNFRTPAGLRLVADRLRGAANLLFSSAMQAEASGGTSYVKSFGMDGYSLGTAADFNVLGTTYINHLFRRAKGFFDIVCDTGTGVAHGVNHGLSVAPEFIIRKSRSGAAQWECWHSALAATEKLVLNTTAAKVTDATAWNSTLPTSTQFTVGTGANVNTNAATYVTYLFATLAGISKVGSYTGNGTSQTIDCGFATGARLILVKRANATGDWYVWDSVRGIVAANDPHLSLNTIAVEVTTDDSVDPEASGFIVNQNTATNINVNGGQYIFLAIA